MMDKQKKKEKHPFQLGLSGAMVFYVIAIIMNLILPLKEGDGIGLKIWSVLDIAIWAVGFLNAFGFIKQIESKDEDGNIIYRTSVPLIPVTLLRVAQTAFYCWKYKTVMNVTSLIILCILDVLIAIFLFIDKGTYVFESFTDE